jgi:Carboxypeptidase regulatory-like domain
MTRMKAGKPYAEASLLAQAGGCSRARACSSSAMARVCRVALALAALGLVLDPASLMAKREKLPTSKTVVGQVFDASGNGIAGAAVEVKNLTTGETLAIYTGPQGRFQFTDLKLTQDYQFRAHYKGRSSEVRKVSSWDTRTNLVLNLQIPPPKD